MRIMLMQSNNVVTLICGDNSKPYLSDRSRIIFLSPFTAWRLVGSQKPYALLGDYSPSEKTGQSADESLYLQIEVCLQQEADTVLQNRWWPLAYRRLMARLSRYRWLKWCLREVIRVHQVSHLRITSGEDRELVMAAQTVGEEEGVIVEILTGKVELPLNVDHMIRQTGMELKIDPSWLIRIQTFLWRLFLPSAELSYQPYWNFDLSKSANCSPLYLNRVISLASTVRAKLAKFSLLGQKYPPNFYDLWASSVVPEVLCVKTWEQYFSCDERVLIAQILGTFVKEYPIADIDRAGDALKSYLRARSTKSVLLMHDKLDSCRLLAWAAHAVGASVDYLPHGLVFEDAAGQKSSSSFDPDRILTWSSASANVARDYAWNAEPVVHPHFDGPIPIFKALKKNWKDTRVLVLVADWVYLTQAGREDCAWVWLKDILEVLNDLGVEETNTYVKLHQHNRDANSHYDEVVATLTSLLSFQPLWVPKISRFSDILSAYDLVICGLTTGIYECAMHGVPHVIYGMSPQRVGVLRGIDVPHAKNSKELITCLSRFDNERAANANSALCAKLKAGKELGSACLSGIIT